MVVVVEVFGGSISKHHFRRRPHRRAIHCAFNSVDLRKEPFFYAVHPVTADDAESDCENDYRLPPNQFRVYSQEFKSTRETFLSKFLEFWPKITIALFLD